MPYYVFQVRPFAQIEKLAEFAVFREASSHAKTLRAAHGTAQDRTRFQVMFADNEDQAIELLCQTREPGPSGDE